MGSLRKYIFVMKTKTPNHEGFSRGYVLMFIGERTCGAGQGRLCC